MTALALVTAVGVALATAAIPQRHVSLLLAIAGLSTPLLSQNALVRGGLGLLEMILLMRAIDLYRLKAQWTFAQRLKHLVSIVDTRLLKPSPRRFDGSAALRVAIFGSVGAAGVIAVYVWPDFKLPVGAVAAYSLVEVIWATAHLGYAALGFTTPALHRLPLASASVRELWGERWTQPVRHFMQMNVVRKLGRRSLRAGMLLSFVLSGVAHGYAVLLYAGVIPALLMLSFFAVQGPLVLLENALKVPNWPRPAAHAWTIAAMLATSPLFTGPVLLVLPASP